MAPKWTFWGYIWGKVYWVNWETNPTGWESKYAPFGDTFAGARALKIDRKDPSYGVSSPCALHIEQALLFSLVIITSSDPFRRIASG